jgi:signal transduction histidine kinase
VWDLAHQIFRPGESRQTIQQRYGGLYCVGRENPLWSGYMTLLGSAAPWRSWAYTATGAVLGYVTLLAVLVLTALGTVLSLVLVGLPILVAAGLSGIAVGAVERTRLRLLGIDPPRSPHRRLRDVGLRQRVRIRASETATWRELAYTWLFATGLWVVNYVATTIPLISLLLVGAPLAYALGADIYLGFELTSLPTVLIVTAVAVPGFVLGLYLVTAVAKLHAKVALTLLTGPAAGTTDDMELIRSNGRLLDAFDAERRRIERDLHDGAQQRLVALTVLLDLARMKADDPALPDLLTRAHAEATTTLTEMRALVQGIHPHTLVERGLPVAVGELVAGYPVPVDLKVRGLGRLPSAVESTAYFVISEALTNVTKHTDADEVWVCAQIAGDLLVVEVGDSGRGGADPHEGSGLRGLADRVAAVGGRALISSPRGGPTVLRVEIPIEGTER